MSKVNKSIVPDEIVINKIYVLRGERIILDRDLAELYDVKPIRLREQVKRNSERFPEKFMMQLTEARSRNHGIAKCDTIKTSAWWKLALCIY